MTVVAIGFFDGVHLGHRQILEGAEIAVTFRNHPLTVLNAAKAPRLIMSYEDRVAAIKACGVREVVALDFTTAVASQSPEEFLSFLQLHTSTFSLRCGANWRFGKGGVGNPDWLREHGVAVEVVAAVDHEGLPISSTRIRECLHRGEIAAANAMLGRRFRVIGSVVEGKGEGRKLGYPTINLSFDHPPLSTSTSSLHLPLGVYQVAVGGHRAVANYGYAPTFGERAWKEPVLEVHFLDKIDDFPMSTSSLDLMSVDFVKFIRPERKFASLAELQAQIAADIADSVSPAV